MKDLSKETVSLIVSALITVRLEAFKDLQAAERMKHLSYLKHVQQALDENATALRELAQDVAPWLMYHPQLLDVFDVVDTAPQKENAQC